MFRRRQKRSALHRTRDLLWPRIGWRRATRYVFHRTARLPGTPYSLAAGFACGAAISFTPLVGFHIILGVVWAWAIRANVLAATIGTVVGNPWTFPFIWLWIYEFGHWLGAGPVLEDGAATLDFAAFFGHIMDASLRLDLEYLAAMAAPVWWPMFVGSLPTVAVIWLAFYLPLRPAIAGYRNRRFLRRQARREAIETERRIRSEDRREGEWDRRHGKGETPEDTGERRTGEWDRRHGTPDRRDEDDSKGEDTP